MSIFPYTTILKTKVCIILIYFFTLPSFLFAAEQINPQETVSLQEVLENITKTDPSILEAIKQYQSVLAERTIATSEYYPIIGTELSTGPEQTDGVDTNDVEKNLIATNATLFARQNLFNGGKTTAFVKETDARILAAAYEVLNVANTVYLDTAEAYINVVKTRELLKIAEENALTQEKIMRQVREKTEAGFNRVSELYNSESRLALSKGSYISRQQDLNQALVIFHRQFGRLLGAEQFVKPEPNYHVPDTLPDAVEIALHTHPALKVAKYNIQTSRYSYEKSVAADLPTLDFEVKGQYRDDTGGDEGDTTQVGAYLTLNYTIFDGGLRNGEKSRDKQSVRKEYQRSYIERRNVNETVRLAWKIKEAEDHKEEYLSEHMELSAKTLDAFKEEYYVGRRTLLDLLNMENEYTEAKLSLSESQFSHLIAMYQIMQATGVLLTEYDTGLHAILKISPDETDDIFDEENPEEIAAYENINENRDQDQFADVKDQCDNSISGSIAEPHGCNDNTIGTIGYPHTKDSELSPYIEPQSFNTSTDPTSPPVPSSDIEVQEEFTAKPSIIRSAKYLADTINKGVVHLDIEGNAQPIVSILKGDFPRIILDFTRAFYKTSNKIVTTEDGPVKSIRFGLHKSPIKKTRVVIDVTNQCNGTLPTIVKKDGGMDIEIECSPY